MNKLFLSLIIALSVLFGVFVFAQTIVGNFVVNANSCYESDGGLDYGVYGNVTGSFWWPISNSSNGTFVGTFTDVCISNVTLLEGVCGSSISSIYSGVAGAVYVDCNVPNSSFGCVNGACRLVGTNATNLTLYDDFSSGPLNTNKCLASGGCGPIGYWNGVPDLGAQIGTYRINFDFFQNQVRMTAIRPDNITIINTFTGNSAPYTLDINTHTGHNGLMHFDYDNFFYN